MTAAADNSEAGIYSLRKRFSAFVHHLRLNQFNVGTAQSLDVLQMLASNPLHTRQEVCLKLKILLCGDKSHWDQFDDLFEAYWFQRGRERLQAEPTHNKEGATEQKLWQNHLQENSNLGNQALPQIENDQHSFAEGGAAGRLVATAGGNRARTDLRHIVDPQAMREAEALTLRLAQSIRYRLSRRYKVQARGRQPDLRRTLRANMSHGGEPFNLVRKSPPTRPVRIVVFLDVSGSMKHYTRFFLQFVKGLVGRWSDTDAYLFHTRLIRVTETLQQKDAMVAMHRLALVAEGFGGGTKLGECLQTFNKRYARQAINSRTVAIILSDGYDTGSAEQLAAQLAQLKRRARKLVWLNPLLGWKNYAPVSAAMTAALPWIDEFAAANTIESLAQLEPVLKRL